MASLFCSWEKWVSETFNPWPECKRAGLRTCSWLSRCSSFLKVLLQNCNIFLPPSLSCIFPLISCFFLFSSYFHSHLNQKHSCLDQTWGWCYWESWVATLSTNCGHLFAFAVTGDPTAQMDLFTPGGMGQCSGDTFLTAFCWQTSFSFSSRYIERKAFLDRVDHRQFEIERDLRLSKMKP